MIDSLQLALDYLNAGIGVIPVIAGDKRPLIPWKEFQSRLPTRDEILSWPWLPNSGIATVLGPVSNLFAIDVDGLEAYEALINVLGELPAAPTSISGSGKPCRFHLLFRHPPCTTAAMATPWHPQLEFRGQGGLLILPPSLHPSGNRYAWAAGRSLADMPLLEVPPLVLAALESVAKRKQNRAAVGRSGRPVAVRAVPINIGICRKTKRFLRGEYAETRRWNERLFNAACDLAGCRVPLEEAMPLLLAGARPWNSDEAENARRTIESAYSEPRTSARSLAANANQVEPVASWDCGGITVHELAHPDRRHLPPSATYEV